MQLLTWLVSFSSFLTLSFSLTIDPAGTLYTELTSTNPTTFANDIAFWTVTSSTSPYYSTCAGKPILGGPGIGGNFARTFENLPSHTAIEIIFQLYALDSWTGTQSVLVTVGSKTINFSGATASGTNSDICGSSSKDYGISTGRLLIFHNGNSVTISFAGSGMNANTNTNSWGIRDLRLFFFTKGGLDVELSCYITPTGNAYTGGNKCTCTSNSQFNQPTSGCSSCQAQCDACADTVNLYCIGCKAGYYATASGCVQCPAECGTCDSATKCTSCASNFYLYRGQCVTCADPPMTWDGTSCYTTCDQNFDMLYWDGNCYPLTDCYAPMEAADIGGYYVCSFPCNTGQWAYSGNGSCLDSCDIPYYSKDVYGEKICFTPCRDLGLYENDDYTCALDCPAPYITINYGSYNHCAAPCNPGEYFYQNLSCIASCDAPFTTWNDGSNDICDLCSNITDYYYNNGSCFSTCPSPFVARSENGYKYCDFPCSSSQFLLTNGSCASSCTSPFTSNTISTIYKYCYTGCPSTISLKNGTCVSTCESPWISSTDPYSLCSSPCSSSYAYSDSSCRTSCLSPLVHVNQYYDYCANPCSDGEFYVETNGTCVAACDSPNTQNVSSPYVSVCNIVEVSNPPDNSTNNTNSSGSNGTNNTNQTNTSNSTNTSNNTNSSNGGGGAANNTNNTNSTNNTNNSNNSNNTNNTNNTNNNQTFVNRTNNKDDVGVIPVSLAQTSYSLGSFSVAAATVGSTIGAASGYGVSAFGMITLNRFLFYLKFLKISFPDNLKNYFIVANNTGYVNLAVSFPTGDMKFPDNKPIPDVFMNWGLFSSYIANYWETFSTIICSIGFALGFMICEYIAKRLQHRDMRFFFQQTNIIFRWNFALIQFCTGYDSITLYASFEFRTYDLGTGIGVISFLSAIVSVVMLFFFLWLTYKLAKGNHQAKNQIVPENLTKRLTPAKRFMDKWRGFQILFAGYKDDTVLAQGLIFFFMLRNIVWICIIVFLFEYPFLQLILMSSLSLFMLCIMLVKKPFQNLVSKFEIPALEFITLFVHVNALALCIIDKYDIVDEDAKQRLGSVIVMGFTAFGVVAFGCMLAYFILGVQITIRTYKQMKAAGAVSFFLMITIPFVSYGMDFKEVEEDDEDISPVKIFDRVPLSLGSTMNPWKSEIFTSPPEMSEMKSENKELLMHSPAYSMTKIQMFQGDPSAETGAGDSTKSTAKLILFEDLNTNNDSERLKPADIFSNGRRRTVQLRILGENTPKGTLTPKSQSNFDHSHSNVSKKNTIIVPSKFNIDQNGSPSIGEMKEDEGDEVIIRPDNRRKSTVINKFSPNPNAGTDPEKQISRKVSSENVFAAFNGSQKTSRKTTFLQINNSHAFNTPTEGHSSIEAKANSENVSRKHTIVNIIKASPDGDETPKSDKVIEKKSSYDALSRVNSKSTFANYSKGSGSPEANGSPTNDQILEKQMSSETINRMNSRRQLFSQKSFLDPNAIPEDKKYERKASAELNMNEKMFENFKTSNHNRRHSMLSIPNVKTNENIS